MTTATEAGERKWPISGNLGKQSASHWGKSPEKVG